MNDIKVSICCTAYNHENYIRQAIEGFLMQKTNFNFEVLIHDDASTDKTAEIIKEYELKYPNIIKPIYQTENQLSKGVSISRTYLYPNAKGEYIAWCEGDDFWIDENKLQRQVDFLDENKQYSACVHRYITVNEFGEETNLKTFGYYEDEGIYTLKDFEQKELPSQLATYVARNIFLQENVSYPQIFDTVKIQGDVKIALYLLTYGDFYRLSDISSAYRFVCKKGGASWSSRQLSNPYASYKRWKEYRKLEKAYYKEYSNHINLKRRRINAAVDVIKAMFKKFNLKTIRNAFVVLIMQRGLVLALLKSLFKKK